MDLDSILNWLIWLLFSLIIVLATILTKMNGLMTSVLTAWLMIPITYYLSTYFFGKKKYDRWKSLKSISLSELNKILNGIFTDVANITDFDCSATASGDSSNEELMQIIDKKLIEQLHFKVKEKSAKLKGSAKNRLLDGKYGPLFERRHLQLERYLDRYNEYIKPGDITNILKISKGLYALDMEISIRNKYKDNGWILFETEDSIEKTITFLINEILEGLDYFNRERIFVYPSKPAR